MRAPGSKPHCPMRPIFRSDYPQLTMKEYASEDLKRVLKRDYRATRKWQGLTDEERPCAPENKNPLAQETGAWVRLNRISSSRDPMGIRHGVHRSPPASRRRPLAIRCVRHLTGSAPPVALPYSSRCPTSGHRDDPVQPPRSNGPRKSAGRSRPVK